MARIVLSNFLALFFLANYTAAAEHVVVQKNKAFSVSEISVKAGDKIVFKNDDTVAHNVSSITKEFPINLKMQLPGTSESVAFENEGKIELRCVMHPAMKLTVNVRK